LFAEVVEVRNNLLKKYLKIGVSLYNNPCTVEQHPKSLSLGFEDALPSLEDCMKVLRIYELAISKHVRINHSSLLEWDGVIGDGSWDEILSYPNNSSKLSDSIFNDQQRENIVLHIRNSMWKDLYERHSEAINMGCNFIDMIGHEKYSMSTKKIKVYQENAISRLEELAKKEHDKFMQSPQGQHFLWMHINAIVNTHKDCTYSREGEII